MKKIVALLIAVILCLFACCALGEEAAMLRQDELINLRTSWWSCPQHARRSADGV